MNYIEIDFETVNEDQLSQLVALLSEHGFEGFEEEGNLLKSFIAENQFSQESLDEVIRIFENISYTKSVVENINWNEAWEKSFEPVKVGNFVAIRADFHTPINDVKHEIIITPQMSFGTGHHATTYLMLQQMEQLDFTNKSVLDFGTGTGVLAIVADKMGAKEVVAIDYDEWSIRNAQENIAANGCSHITVNQSDVVPGAQQFDIILANINLNVIVQNMSSIAKAAGKQAMILVSGFFKTDEPAILECIRTFHLTHVNSIQKGEWMCLVCKK